MRAMKRSSTYTAQRYLTRIRRLVSKSRLPSLEPTDEQVIQMLRKTRKELWEAKIASGTR